MFQKSFSGGKRSWLLAACGAGLALLALVWARFVPLSTFAADEPSGQTAAADPGAAQTPAADPAADWVDLLVPQTWEQDPRFGSLDGYANYQCQVAVPQDWKDGEASLHLGQIDNACEVFFDGHKLGSLGSLPPSYKNGVSQVFDFAIPVGVLRPGQNQTIYLRFYDEGGAGGFTAAAPYLARGDQAILLGGLWKFRPGQETGSPQPAEGAPVFSELAARPAAEPGFQVLSATEALTRFTVPADLKLELVLAEPDITQPLFVHFDERGRLWVVEYRQYPEPAGLKMVSRDNVWRVVYDKVPLPPPNHFPGRDRISIHEDTNGDGTYDAHKTFVEGLSIVTSLCRGRGGVWVLNPPYLLFYPDANHDDIPDGDPEVHLAGFGMEDTHSVSSNLCFGPDGWLYASQGSTVSASITRPGFKDPPVFSHGQLIWRYHPEKRIYEVFSEGGGNAFGCEIDAYGRVFSGHNGGDTRGFAYVQGGYFQKSFGKHGALSNPYAFGFFPAMKHPQVPRFTHSLVLYQGGALGAEHEGRLFGVAPLLNYVSESDIFADGSSFQTNDVQFPVSSSDSLFRPVHITSGPDGALYVSDFYEAQIAHLRHNEGQIDRATGRIYRLSAANEPATKERFDLAQASSPELVARLEDPNRWMRHTALRVLGDRKDTAVVPVLAERIAATSGDRALDYLWALNLSGGWSEEQAIRCFEHPHPQVRLWAARLLGDEHSMQPATAEALRALAARETDVHVRSQLACTARRLSAEQGLPVVAALISNAADADDIHIPLLLWWAIESKAAADPEAVVQLLSAPETWTNPLVEKHLLSRIMRRFAQSGTRKELLLCAQLLQMAPAESARKQLLAGFEEAFTGRTLLGVPDELLTALAAAGDLSLPLKLRQQDPEATPRALEILADEAGDLATRIELADVLGEVRPEGVDARLADLLGQTGQGPLQVSLISGLQKFDNPALGERVLASYGKLTEEAQPAALAMLASRKAWSLQLMGAVASNAIPKEQVPDRIVRKLLLHEDTALQDQVRGIWGELQGATTSEMRIQADRLTQLILTSTGDPYAGKQLFTKTCGKCHRLFEEGGRIGPDLTSYRRSDVATMVLHVVNPSAEIREGYEGRIVETNDGQILIGFLVDQDNQVVVLRDAEGTTTTIPLDNVALMQPADKSIMPERILDGLSEDQIRDLFAYLRSTQPLVLRGQDADRLWALFSEGP